MIKLKTYYERKMKKLKFGVWSLEFGVGTVVLFLLFTFYLLLTVLTGASLITPLYAFTINPPSYGIQAQGNAGSLLQTILKNAVRIIFTIGAILVIAYMLWGAIDLIMSGGDKEKLGNARKKITSALIGLVLLALTFFIASLLGRIVGFDPLQTLPIPSLGDR